MGQQHDINEKYQHFVEYVVFLLLIYSILLTIGSEK